ncbi:S-adenosyl-L-methionine-dependent methyltransferase [Meredithblackwellia eburnea MCA 4105]
MSHRTAAQHLTFAKSNFSFSGASGLYDRARPKYPIPAVDKIINLLPADSDGASAVELGSGTGIFTRMLLDRASQHKGRLTHLTCVEPAEGMRKGFHDKLASEGIDPAKAGIQLNVVDGLFDAIPAKDASLDLVFAAQAWHWSNDGVSAIKEVARVLKPGGHLALIWNLENREKARWVAQLRDTYEIHEGGTPQYRLGLWKAMFDSPNYKDNYVGPPDYEQYHTTVVGTEQLVIDRLLSKSFITSLSAEEQAVVVQKSRDVVKKGDDMVFIDKEKGTFEYPYSTDLFIMTKKA